MDFWLKARSFAEEAAKRSQEFTKEAAKRSQELTIGGSAKLSDVVLEASKRSKEIAAEASKRSKEIVAEASKRAEEIKVDALKRAEQITSQIPAAAISHLVDSSSTGSTQTTAAAAEAAATQADLERFGVTDELREFVKGITLNTFQDFPLQGANFTRSCISDALIVLKVNERYGESKMYYISIYLVECFKYCFKVWTSVFVCEFTRKASYVD